MSKTHWIGGVAAAIAAFVAGLACANPTTGLSFIDAERFATLPADVRFPEGIAADPATGSIFVGTFDTSGATTNKLVRLDRSGHVSAVRDFGVLNDAALDDALRDFAESLEARDDLHATADYRRDLVRLLGRRTIEDARCA